MYLIILLLLTPSFIHAKSSFEQNCENLLLEIEDKLKDVFLIGNISVPRDTDTLKQYEKLYKSTYESANKYKPCNQGLEREVFNTLTSGINKMIRDLFGSKSNKKKLLHTIRCYDDELINSMRGCLTKYSNQITYIHSNTTENSTIPALCCSGHLGRQCMTDEITAFCKDGRDDAIKFMNYMMDAIVGDLMFATCGDFRKAEQCPQLIPNIIDALRNVPATQMQNQMDGFLVRPLLSIVRKISEQQTLTDSATTTKSHCFVVFLLITVIILFS